MQWASRALVRHGKMVWCGPCGNWKLLANFHLAQGRRRPRGVEPTWADKVVHDGAANHSGRCSPGSLGWERRGWWFSTVPWASGRVVVLESGPFLTVKECAPRDCSLSGTLHVALLMCDVSLFAVFRKQFSPTRVTLDQSFFQEEPQEVFVGSFIPVGAGRFQLAKVLFQPMFYFRDAGPDLDDIQRYVPIEFSVPGRSWVQLRVVTSAWIFGFDGQHVWFLVIVLSPVKLLTLAA